MHCINKNSDEVIKLNLGEGGEGCSGHGGLAGEPTIQVRPGRRGFK
jgi:hypothetical protein